MGRLAYIADGGADAKVLIDFGGRNWIVRNTSFRREKLVRCQRKCFSFLKVFSDAANAI
jgi:imidazoleglycerol-phosphate dehydratase/histidinol-phosphatase